MKIMKAEVGNDDGDGNDDQGHEIIEPDVVGVGDTGYFQDDEDNQDDFDWQSLNNVAI